MTNVKSEALHKKVRSIIITAAVCLLIIVALINFVTQVAKFNELQTQKEKLLEEKYETENNIEELEYWLGAPMDDDYIMKFAREKLELYRADEIVFAGNTKTN